MQEGQGAFYGPKLEIVLKDRRGREWQCGTIQVDLVMPVRFGAKYVDASGERQPLVMLHRALYGSLERFLGIVLEQHGAALPPWLAPEQILVVPVSPEQQDRAREVASVLRSEGLRPRLDERSESLARRIADAHSASIPFLAVIGAREAEAGSVSLRQRRAGDALELDLPSVLAHLSSACARPEI